MATGVLSELRIENFKSLEKVAVSPKLVTVFIGPNGAGKSSIIQALALLKQSRNNTNLNFAGPLIQFGDFSDVVFRHDLNRSLSFSLTGTIEETPAEVKARKQQGAYAYRLEYDQQGVTRNAVQLRGVVVPQFSAEWRRNVPTPRSTLTLGNNVVVGYDPHFAIGVPVRSAGMTVPSNTPPEAVERANAWSQEIFGAVTRVLEQMYFVPANRGFDQTGYNIIPNWVTDFMSSVGTTQQSAMLAGSLVYKRELVEQRLSTLMRRVTDVEIRAPLAPGPKVTVQSDRDGFSSIIVNEGFGSNQLVMLLATLLDPPPGALISIEEPEIHLHPRAQARLAEVLVETALQDRKQLLLTTHSEHLVVGLLTKVAAGRLRPDDLALYYVDRAKAATDLKMLPVDDRGRVAGGLDGFFEADVSQVQSYLEALSQKKPSTSP